MGMFDTIRSSYDLGPGYLNKNLQTKDLDCLMQEYWISPRGELFEIDYSGTQDFVESRDPRWPVFKTAPNGNHGRVTPVDLFAVITVYPEKWDCKYAPFPRCQIFFKDGIIQEVRHSSSAG